MRITGYRTLTTRQEWGRPVGDANGVFPDGIVDVQLVLVDTDEGITGVGLGSHLDLENIFAAIAGEDPRSTAALYDRMLRQAFKAGHAGAVFGTVGALDAALWDAGLTHKKRKSRRDMVAAQILLQTYLDAGCPAEAPPGALDS